MWEEHELSKMLDGSGIPFTMLSDQGGEVGAAYGVYDESAGVDIRGRFLIDPDFVIQAAEIITPSVGRNFEETIRQLKAFMHVRETGEVTPAGWQPGLPTLTPGPELVGRVWEHWQPK
jgi:peroxiredoxin (alkyl hydroperoxide reductase subunit C)